MIGASMIAFVLYLSSPKPSDLGKAYIEQYKTIAIEEMQRTGIPASIKLAQGLLESDWGRSDLAQQANNHFGIKCGNGWLGEEYYKQDDDFHTDGSLMHSCFRKFENPQISFKAHSDFLSDPKKQTRYGFLFSLSILDYKAWSEGLKKAGYATDPSYPSKLIAIIEKFQLYKLDSLFTGNPQTYQMANEQLASASKPEKFERIKKYETADSKLTLANKTTKLNFSSINNSRCTVLKEEMNVESLSRSTGIGVADLITFNESLNFEYDVAREGSIIYIEKKKRDYTGNEDFYYVKDNESLIEISQKYGILTSTLCTLNRLPPNAIILKGEKISLKRKIDAKHRPKYKRSSNGEKGKDFLF